MKEIIQSSSFSGYTCHRLHRTNDEQCLRNPIAISFFFSCQLTKKKETVASGQKNIVDRQNKKQLFREF
jgi:hypothetical protein